MHRKRSCQLKQVFCVGGMLWAQGPAEEGVLYCRSQPRPFLFVEGKAIEGLVDSCIRELHTLRWSFQAVLSMLGDLVENLLF